MNYIPKKPTVWVGDDNTEYTVQDYISQTPMLKAFSYILYIILWGGGIHLLILFNTQYDRASIISAFLIGIILIFALDWINDLTWEIAVNKADKKYYLINNSGPLASGYRIMNKNSVFKMKKPNHHLLLVDAYKYKKYLESGKIKDTPFVEWKEKEFKESNKAVETDIQSTAKSLSDQIEIIMNCAYYVFTILITLSAVAYRINKKLFYRILPWVLGSAIVGLGSMFIMLWEKTYQQFLLHLTMKKKLLLTSISFALAACFIFLNNI
jgi:hypothetical protein